MPAYLYLKHAIDHNIGGGGGTLKKKFLVHLVERSAVSPV